MSRILFTGARIMTMDPERQDCFVGDLLVEKDRIASISEKSGSIEGEQGDRIIDGSGLLLMPG